MQAYGMPGARVDALQEPHTLLSRAKLWCDARCLCHAVANQSESAGNIHSLRVRYQPAEMDPQVLQLRPQQPGTTVFYLYQSRAILPLTQSNLARFGTICFELPGLHFSKFRIQHVKIYFIIQ